MCENLIRLLWMRWGVEDGLIEEKSMADVRGGSVGTWKILDVEEKKL